MLVRVFHFSTFSRIGSFRTATVGAATVGAADQLRPLEDRLERTARVRHGHSTVWQPMRDPPGSPLTVQSFSLSRGRRL